jgi:hypothetical protein
MAAQVGRKKWRRMRKNGWLWAREVCPRTTGGSTNLNTALAVTNGCSGPRKPFEATLENGCYIHDVGYGCAAAYGVSRAAIDRLFGQNNLALCQQRYCRKYWDSVQRGWCFIAAKTYQEAVERWGKDHYRKAGNTLAHCNKPCVRDMTMYQFPWQKFC